MKCEACGEEFERKCNRQKYCDGCRKAMGKKMMQDWKKKNAQLIKAKPCEICGKEFAPKGGGLTCSPECRAERERPQQLKRNEANKAKRTGIRGVYKPRTEKRKKSGLDGKLEIARKAGQTYGDMQRAQSLASAGRIDVTLGGRI